MRKPAIIFPIVLLALLIVLAIYSLSYPFQTQLFPLVICIPVIALVLIQVVREISQSSGSRRQEGNPAEQGATGSRAVWRGHALIIAWMTGFLLMIYIVGFILAIPLFLFLYLKLHGSGWLRSLGLAAGMVIVIYSLFTLAMKMHFYPGVLFS